MKVCVVGSLSGIFTHAYIRGLVNRGYDVSVINTSRKISYENYNNCEVLNLFDVTRNKLNAKNKARIKENRFFCYLYETYLSLKALLCPYDKIEHFLTNKKIDKFIFFWGTSVRREFFTIYKKHKGQSEFILDVATYPVRDYAVINSFKVSLWFDTLYFKKFDIILSHSTVMDKFLCQKFGLNERNIKRFICSFPKQSYLTKHISSVSLKIKKVIFLGTLDPSSSINNINDDIIAFAKAGIEVHIMSSSQCLNYKNIYQYTPFSYEQILEGKLADFCSGFDAALIAYGQMSSLREKLTYPTRFAMAALQNIPVLIQSSRFESLTEIVQNFPNEVIFYSSVDDVTKYNIKNPLRYGLVTDCIESKLDKLLL